WEVFLNTSSLQAKSLARKKGYPTNALVPVVRTGERSIELQPGGTPARFSKSEAEHIAHRIGSYQLNLGDMIFSYVEERKEETRRDVRRRKTARDQMPFDSRLEAEIFRSSLAAQGARMPLVGETRDGYVVIYPSDTPERMIRYAVSDVRRRSSRP